MIRALYLDFGFFSTLAICLLLVVLFIFWMAGIAGIVANPDNKGKKAGNLSLILCVLIPIYPIIWLISDMVKEYVTIRRHSTAAKQNRFQNAE